MLFTTPTQFVALLLVLVAGWLFGLASHPGGRKWRERYAAERDAHASNRKQAEARVAETKSRNTELERENARLADAASSAAASVAQPAARPAYAPRTRRASRGWFDWGDRPAS